MPEKQQPGGSLTAKTVHGAIWTWIARGGHYVISLVSVTILARTLPVSAYGLMSMVVVITGFIAIFRDLGTAMAIVRHRDPSREFLSTMFWANIALAVLATTVSAALSPVVAIVYREPEVTPVMFALSFNFLVSGTSAVHSSLLIKQMRFKRIAGIELLAGAASTAVAIALAKSGAGVWSLVAASLTVNLTTALMLFGTASWRPHLCFAWAELRSALSFSLNLSGVNIANYFLRKGDMFLIGRYLGAAPLASYQFAYTLMLFPLENITWALGRVLYPAYVSIQDDLARFRQAYLRVTGIIGLITFPMMLGMMAVTGPFVEVLLGPRWPGVAPILTILAPVGMIQSVSSPVGQIYMAKGRTDLYLRWCMLAVCVYLPALWFGLKWGASGVAAGYAIANAVLLYPLLAFAFRLIDLPVRAFLASQWPCLRAALVMCFTVVLARMGLEAMQLPVLFVFLVCVATGVGVYGALLALTKAPAAQEALNLIAGAAPRSQRAAAALCFVSRTFSKTRE